MFNYNQTFFGELKYGNPKYQNKVFLTFIFRTFPIFQCLKSRCLDFRQRQNPNIQLAVFGFKLIDLDFIVRYQITLKRQSCLKSNKLFGFWPQFSNLKFVSESKQIVWILAPNFKIYKFVSEIQTDSLDFRHIYKFEMCLKSKHFVLFELHVFKFQTQICVLLWLRFS